MAKVVETTTIPTTENIKMVSKSTAALIGGGATLVAFIAGLFCSRPSKKNEESKPESDSSPSPAAPKKGKAAAPEA